MKSGFWGPGLHQFIHELPRITPSSWLTPMPPQPNVTILNLNCLNNHNLPFLQFEMPCQQMPPLIEGSNSTFWLKDRANR